MALFRKLFYKKPPDGLLEISERVYVFDCCFTTDIWEEENYKGYVGGVISQLREHYPDASILVFNFREGGSPSPIANVLSEYDMTIMDYPRHYESCPLLSMEMIHHFLRSSESWLSLGQQNVLLMHCERGGWLVLAFMLAALLIYRRQYSGEQKTLDMVYKQAPSELLRLLSPLTPIPSQLRYLQYVSRRNVATEWPPLDRALTLDCIIIRMIPDFDGEGGCRPIFHIYGQDPILIGDRTPKVLYSTSKKGKTVRHFKQAECELVKIDINCQIQGDVVLECISLDDDMVREVMMFRVMFNTAFIRSNILILNRDEVDTLWDAKDRFPKDFRAEVLFSEMDAAASVVPVDLSCLEEKDGLPVEAFAKVHEIFSSVDWASPRSDVALNVLQQIAASNIETEKMETDSHQITEASELMKGSTSGEHQDIQRPPVSGSIAKTLISLTSEKHSASSNLSPYADLDIQKVELQFTKYQDEADVPPKPSFSLSVNSFIPSTENVSASSPSLLKLSHHRDSLKETSVEQVPGNSDVPCPIPTIEALPPKSVAATPLLPAASEQHSKIECPPFPPAIPMTPLTPPLKDNVSVKSASPSPPPPPPPLPPHSSKHITPISKDDIHPGSAPRPPPPPPPPISSSSMDDAYVKAEPPPAPPPPPFPTTSPCPPTPPPAPLLKETSSPRVGVPPPPPPPPSQASSFSVAGSPPPPPPPPSTQASEVSSSFRAKPPPPPPPPGLSSSAALSSNSSVPPPPAPPAPSSSSGIPSAPPPPIPSTKQNLKVNGGPPTPPPSIPPPGLKGRAMMSRPISKSNSGKKLKPLHWLKLTRAVSGSLWAEAQKSGEATRTPEIDISELETLFSAATSNPDKGGSGRKSGLQASLGQKPEKVQLVDHRRAYNCEIMLSKVKIPLHDLLTSVLSLEDSALDADQVENLIKFCPTKEEMEVLKGYKGDKDKLGRCEQFFLELMQVPRIENKLRVFSFKMQFKSQLSDLRNSLNIVNSASDQIRGSAKLKRIMQTILSLGNALNQGTARGSAVGFRLDSLLKLTDTRARNNKMTLMHYLCKVLADKLPELLDFAKDLSSLEAASRVQLKYLAEEMQAISKGLEKIVQELSMSENDGPVSDNFHKALKEFLSFAEGEVRCLASLYSGVGRNVDALILYFGEDPSRCPFEQVVSTLLNFVRMFNKAHEENCKQLELDKKKAEKEAALEKLKVTAPERDSGRLINSPIGGTK